MRVGGRPQRGALNHILSSPDAYEICADSFECMGLVKERILQIEEYMYRPIVDNVFVSNFVGLALTDSSAYACLSGRVFRFRVLRGTHG
jgi:hypothetical protein